MNREFEMPVKQQRIATLMVLLISACMANTAIELEDIPQTNLRDRLRAGMSFELAPTENDSAEIRASLLRSNEESEAIDIEIIEGILELSADRDDSSQVDTLTIGLGDVFVPASVFPPTGIELTEISLELEKKTGQSIALSWSQNDERVDGSFTADLIVHWSVGRDGRVIGLADMVIENVPIHLTIDDLDGGARSSQSRVTLSIHKDGAFWRWADTFEFRDLGLDIGGRTPQQFVD